MLRPLRTLVLIVVAFLAGLPLLESVGWARYGFGADWAVRTNFDEATIIKPKQEQNG